MDQGPDTEPVEVAGVPPFVDAAWLRAHPDAVAVDVRFTLATGPDREAYRRGHLPGAVFASLDDDLSGPTSTATGRHPLPTPDRFAHRVGQLGIGDEDVVVAYDGGHGAVAARLVWMLRRIGQPAAVLDGGLAAWDGPIETGDHVRAPVRREARPWPRDLLLDADAAGALARDGVLLDARDEARFLGDVELVDARAGHVPGATNMPHTGNAADGVLAPRDELAERYAVALEADAVGAYCGSGVTACHDLLVLEHLGRADGRLYPGSWSQWAASDRPAATGPA